MPNNDDRDAARERAKEYWDGVKQHVQPEVAMHHFARTEAERAAILARQEVFGQLNQQLVGPWADEECYKHIRRWMREELGLCPEKI